MQQFTQGHSTNIKNVGCFLMIGISGILVKFMRGLVQ